VRSYQQIPAGAGETFPEQSIKCRLRAYPRWRGGNVAAAFGSKEDDGLSPLARGKRECRRREVCFEGPIPAGAGETGATRQ